MVLYNPFKVRINVEYNKVLSSLIFYYLLLVIRVDPYKCLRKMYIYLSKIMVLRQLKMVSVSQKIMIILSKKMATDATRKYSTLTSSYTVDNNRKYLSRGPNCWIISAIPSMVKVQTWNDLENSLIAISEFSKSFHVCTFTMLGMALIIQQLGPRDKYLRLLSTVQEDVKVLYFRVASVAIFFERIIIIFCDTDTIFN